MKVRIHDLSLGGCLIETSGDIEIGRRLTLRLDVPGGESLSIEGETVRAQAQSRYAVKFVELDDAMLGRLERALDRMLRMPLGPALGGAATVERDG